MKTYLAAATAAMVLTSAVMAAEPVKQHKGYEDFGKNFDRIVRIGVDVQGNQDDVTAGVGDKKKMGYEIAFGAERKVEDFRFGSRIMNTIYNYGDKTYYDGPNETLNRNYGLEMSLSRFYKATKYFKPYLGGGFGINQSKTTNNTTNAMQVSYAPTLHLMGGVSGEVIAGIGYYVEVKRRFADHTNKIDGVDGTMTTAGVSYQF